MRLYSEKKENNKSRAAANNLPSGKGVKQLMTIYPADTKKIDRIISADVKLQSDRAGGNMYESKDLKADKSLPLSDGEGIIVVGHGATGVVEGTDGEVIGTSIKNSVTEIKNAKYVYLSACETAKGGEGSAANKVAKGLGIDPSPTESATTVGANFYIHPNVVFKADYQKFKVDNLRDRFDLGIGFLF